MRLGLMLPLVLALAFPASASARHHDEDDRRSCDCDHDRHDSRDRDRDRDYDDWDGDHDGRHHDWHHDGDLELDFDFDVFGWNHDAGGRRIQILDLPLFSLVDVRSREPDLSHVEVLDVPLITGFESHATPQGHRLRVLDLPLVSLFRYDRQGDDTDVGFLNLPIVGSLYRQETEAGRRRMNVLFLFRFIGAAPRPASESALDEETSEDGALR